MDGMKMIERMRPRTWTKSPESLALTAAVLEVDSSNTVNFTELSEKVAYVLNEAKFTSARGTPVSDSAVRAYLVDVANFSRTSQNAVIAFLRDGASPHIMEEANNFAHQKLSAWVRPPRVQSKSETGDPPRIRSWTQETEGKLLLAGLLESLRAQTLSAMVVRNSIDYWTSRQIANALQLDGFTNKHGRPINEVAVRQYVHALLIETPELEDLIYLLRGTSLREAAALRAPLNNLSTRLNAQALRLLREKNIKMAVHKPKPRAASVSGSGTEQTTMGYEHIHSIANIIRSTDALDKYNKDEVDAIVIFLETEFTKLDRSLQISAARHASISIPPLTISRQSNVVHISVTISSAEPRRQAIAHVLKDMLTTKNSAAWSGLTRWASVDTVQLSIQPESVASKNIQRQVVGTYTLKNARR